MRAAARERFKERVLHGGLGTGCECHDSPDAMRQQGGRRTSSMRDGVRFIDSGQVYYFDAAEHPIALNDWVVVETSGGERRPGSSFPQAMSR